MFNSENDPLPCGVSTLDVSLQSRSILDLAPERKTFILSSPNNFVFIDLSSSDYDSQARKRSDYQTFRPRARSRAIDRVRQTTAIRRRPFIASHRRVWRFKRCRRHGIHDPNAASSRGCSRRSARTENQGIVEDAGAV